MLKLGNVNEKKSKSGLEIKKERTKSGDEICKGMLKNGESGKTIMRRQDIYNHYTFICH